MRSKIRENCGIKLCKTNQKDQRFVQMRSNSLMTVNNPFCIICLISLLELHSYRLSAPYQWTLLMDVIYICIYSNLMKIELCICELALDKDFERP